MNNIGMRTDEEMWSLTQTCHFIIVTAVGAWFKPPGTAPRRQRPMTGV